jgi:hypothetical protein
MIVLLFLLCILSQNLVPRQHNGFDCGLFVCRYILGIYKLREQTFTHEDVYKNKTPLLKKVTNSSTFIFNQKLVNDFRKQLGELFDNLDHLYHHGKVPKPSGRGKTSSRGRAVSVGMKTVIALDSTVTPQQKDIDSAKELEYASPILDEIRNKNIHRDSAVLSNLDAKLPAVHLNVDADEGETKTSSWEQNKDPGNERVEVEVSMERNCTDEGETKTSSWEQNKEVEVSMERNCTDEGETNTSSWEQNKDPGNERVEVTTENKGNDNMATPPDLYEQLTKSMKPSAEKNELIVKTKKTLNKKTNETNSVRKVKVKLNTATSKVAESRRAKKTPTTTVATSDPFIGKAVAFPCNSAVGQELISEFGKVWCTEAICFHLEPKMGHIVGTVMRRSRGIGSRTKDSKEKYDVVWEFTALGETSVSPMHLLDGVITARSLCKAREKMKPNLQSNVEIRRKDILDHTAMSDDEECMKVRNRFCAHCFLF